MEWKTLFLNSKNDFHSSLDTVVVYIIYSAANNFGFINDFVVTLLLIATGFNLLYIILSIVFRSKYLDKGDENRNMGSNLLRLFGNIGMAFLLLYFH